MTWRSAEPEEVPSYGGMGPGAVVSGALHAGIILLAIFGGQLFSADEAQVMQIAEVDLISGDAFDAAMSTAPEGPRDPAAKPAMPQEGEDAPAAAEADDAPARAETSQADAPPAPAARPEVPAADVAPAPPPEAPAAEPAEETAPPEGVAGLVTPLPEGPDRLDETQRDAPAELDVAPPRDADRIAPTPAEAPETIAEAQEAVEESAPSPEEAETVEVEPEREAAPREATTEVVTEADETSDEAKPAPVASAIPRGRPESVAAAAKREQEKPEPEKKVETAQAETKPEAEKKPEAESAPAGQTADAGRAPRRATSAPLGAKLTQGEIEGVRLGIESKWRKGLVTSMSNYEELVVTVRITLDQSGAIVGAPEPISPLPDSRFKRAFDIASRALRQAAPFDLPAEKYGRWKVIEVTFNPAKGISGFRSG